MAQRKQKLTLPVTYDEVCVECARKGEEYAKQTVPGYAQGHTETTKDLVCDCLSTLSAIIFEMHHRSQEARHD